jgi:hypothetical protein
MLAHMWPNVLQLALLPCQREGLITVHFITNLPSDEPDHYQAVPTQLLLTPREEFWKLYWAPDIEVIKQCLHSLIQTDSQSFLISHSRRTTLAFFSGIKGSSENTKTYPWNSDTRLPLMSYVQGRFHRTATRPVMKHYGLLWWSEYFSCRQTCLWP